MWFLAVALAFPALRPVWTDAGATHLGQPSPDGRFLSGIDPATGDLLVREIASGQNRRLTRNSDPKQFAYFSVFSPDSRQLAFAWFNEEGFYDLRLVPREGAQPRIVFRNDEAGFVQPCAFSPDARHILTLLFRKDNISQIALISVADGAVRVLKSLNWVYPKRMDFSPDGRWIAYDNFASDGVQQRDIFLLAADGSREQRLVEGPSDDQFPVFSSDGTRVYYASGTELRMVRLADRVSTLAAADLGRFLLLGVSRQGQIFYALRKGATGIYQADIDLAAGKLTSRAEQIGEGSSAVWSPDGKRIAWLARQAVENYGVEARMVLIRDVSEPEPRVLSPKLAHLERIAWTAEGKALIISGSDGKGRSGVFQLDAQTGATVPVVQNPGGPHNGYPACATTRGVAYARDGQVWLDGKPVRQAAHSIEALAASPDGKTWVLGGARSLTIDQRTVAVQQPVSALAWSPDGRAVLAVQGDEIWLHRLDGTSIRVAKAASAVDGISLHPNGKSLLFAAGKPKPEIWVIDP
jgi:Tol biopolymer transport system component